MIHRSGFYRHVERCNRHHSVDYRPFWVAGQLVGRMRAEVLEAVLDWPQVFVSVGAGVGLHPRLGSYAERTAAVAEMLEKWTQQGFHYALLGEAYPVTPTGREQALLEIDRSAAALFGLRTFGQHLNGYSYEGDQMLMWIGRRSQDRMLYPGYLDQLVAGGLPAGITPQANLLKECREEAGMPEPLALQARPVGMVSYNTDTKKGYKYDILYCYDLVLPADYRPECMDGEVEEFLLLPVAEVAERVLGGDEFKPNCNLVIIDFLLRHGLIGPEHPEYLALNLGLRAAMSPLEVQPRRGLSGLN